MSRLVCVALFLAVFASPAAMANDHGDAERGQVLYQTCIACHQADGRGNEALNAPNLLGLQDWYILRQLQNFSSGVRGSTRDDVYGQQMRPMAMQLQNDQDRWDVIAYLNTLK